MQHTRPPRLEEHFARRTTAARRCPCSDEADLAGSRRRALLDARRHRLLLRSSTSLCAIASSRERQQQEQSAARRALREHLHKAHAARTAFLTRLAASCAERVARAKAVAVEMREKRLREEQRVRVEMVHRLQRAEQRRRLLLQARGGARKQRPEEAEEETGSGCRGSLEWAAAAVQARWRTARILHARQGMAALQLDSAMDFEARSALVRGKPAVDAAARFFRAVQAVGGTDGSNTGHGKMLLAAWMILHHPQEVLSAQGPMEEALVKAAHALVASIRSSSGPAAKDAWRVYQRCFQAWKVHDQTLLLDLLIDQYLKLERLRWDVATEHKQTAQEWSDGIQHGQLQLLAKIKALSTEGKERLGQRVRSLRRDRRVQQKWHGIRMSNRQIVHALLLNPDFCFEAHMLEAHMLGPAKSAVLSETGPREVVFAPDIAGALRQRLLHLAPHPPLADEITAAIDVDFIAQQCRTGHFSLPDFTCTVLSLMRRICAPARAELLQSIAQLESSEMQLGHILRAISLLQLDHANMQFALAKPELLRHAAGYERRAFEAELDKARAAARDGLERTRAWLLPFQAAKASSRAIWSAAFADLLLHMRDAVPETFRLASQHVRHLHKRLHLLARACAKLLMLKIALGRRTPFPELFEALLYDAEADNGARTAAILVGTPSSVSGLLRAPWNEQDPTQRLLQTRILCCVQNRVRPASASASASSSGSCSIGVIEAASKVEAFVQQAVRLARVNCEIYAPWYDQLLP